MDDLTALVSRALAEDVGGGDVTTTATVPETAAARALITQKQAGVIFGLEVAELVFAQLDPEMRFERLVREGTWREQGEPVLALEGRARAVLTGERTALNFLAHLSGVATMAARATPPRPAMVRRLSGRRIFRMARLASSGVTDINAATISIWPSRSSVRPCAAKTASSSVGGSRRTRRKPYFVSHISLTSHLKCHIAHSLIIISDLLHCSK